LLEIRQKFRVERPLVVAPILGPGLFDAFLNGALGKIGGVVDVGSATTLQIVAGQCFPEITLAAQLSAGGERRR